AGLAAQLLEWVLSPVSRREVLVGWSRGVPGFGSPFLNLGVTASPGSCGHSQISDCGCDSIE
ncbi:MAG: hypothetical protein ACK48X_06495, partial [Planctomycetota bacterium]